MKLYYRMLMHDPDGVLVKDTGLVPSGSYVLQFLQFIASYMGSKGTTTAKDVTGASSNLVLNATASRYIRVDAPALDDTYGVVVGTNAGATAEDNENYTLDTKILHSAIGDAGKMNYRAVTFIAPRVVSGNIDFDITRPYINETGSTITVKEIGIICENNQDTKYHLLLRDVVSDEDVLAGYTLTVVYTLRTTV